MIRNLVRAPGEGLPVKRKLYLLPTPTSGNNQIIDSVSATGRQA